MTRLTASTCALLLGCGAEGSDIRPLDPGGGTLSGGAPQTASAGDDAGADDGPGDGSADGSADGSDGTGGTDAGSAGDDPGTKFDTPDGETEGATGDDGDGCEKIDFLFIVDNSSSMSPHQQNLLDSFGSFMDTIAAEVQGADYHIMALDTDACPTYGGNCMPSSCEEVLGAGQVRDCGIPPDTRYLDSSMGLADIKSGFTCAANVGDGGSHSELPMSAMVAAVGPENAASGCNPGFVRDDAILVVTFITDDHNGFAGDDDVRTVGSPSEWYDAVVSAKNGLAENIVVLGLVALLADQSCIVYGPQQADRFVEFVDRFEDRGLVGSVCEPNYNDFFAQAVGLVDTTCDEFTPPG